MRLNIRRARDEDGSYETSGFEDSWQPPRETVGQTLARARLDLGQDLPMVSEVLRIRRSQLQAIEEGRYDDLPGQTYAIGFVRSYAEYLGLDPVQMVERFKEELTGLHNEEQTLAFPVPKPEGRIPGFALVLISLLLIGVAYGGWYAWNSRDQVLVELLPPVEEERPAQLAAGSNGPRSDSPAESATSPETDSAAEQSQEMVDIEGNGPRASVPLAPSEGGQSDALAPADTTQVTPGDEAALGGERIEPVPPAIADTGEGAGVSPEAAPSGSAQDQPSPEVQPGAIETAEQTQEAGREAPEQEGVADTGTEAGGSQDPAEQQTAAIPAPPGSEAPPPAPEGRVYGAVNENARVILHATADSWIQVRAGEDLLFTRVLRPGEQYRVPDEPGLTLLTGNAGGLEVLVDGVVAPALGPSGAVRRNIALEPDSLLQGGAN